MVRSLVRFARRIAESRRAVVLGAVVGSAVAAGCAARNESSANPEPEGGAKSAAEIEAAVTRAKDRARVSELIRLGNADLASGRYISAIGRARQALADNPDNADAYAMLGAARWRQGDFVRSTRAYRKSLEIEASNYGGALGLARNLQAIGNHTEALAIADTLLAEDAEQLDPYLTKLWSHYALCDADQTVKTVDEIFARMGKDHHLLPVVQAFAAFMRPLAGQGTTCAIEGERGTAALAMDLGSGMKQAAVVVGGVSTTAILLDSREEAVIDEGLAHRLGLEEFARYTPADSDQEVGVTLIPRVEFGTIALVNVPATIQPLATGDPAEGGGAPTVVLGRQALQAFGTITFDFPRAVVELAREAPTGPTGSEVESLLVMLGMFTRYAPIVPISIDGSDHVFFAYLGSTYVSALTMTRKHYLLSGHLPRQLDPPDDAEAGLKMVYIDGLSIGTTIVPGLSGLVLVNEPADPALDVVLQSTQFEVGGHINVNLMRTWRISYAMGSGAVYIDVGQ